MVRSATATPRCCSRLRCCAGDKAWSNKTASAWWACTSALISSALPEPTNSAASGALRRATTRATATSPADSASSASSSSDASNGLPPPKSTPTRIARAGFDEPLAELASAELKVKGVGACSCRGCRLVRLGCLEIHRPTWHDRGDGVLVDHLRHGVAQQHDILIEGFDVALQFDPVDEVD